MQGRRLQTELIEEKIQTHPDDNELLEIDLFGFLEGSIAMEEIADEMCSKDLVKSENDEIEMEIASLNRINLVPSH